MKLHDLRPATGARKTRTRVGRGIAAGQGKTAGRGTKGQRSRTGSSIPAWFEGGQTPIHIRVPKLHGFKNRFRVQYSVVNVGQISAYAEAGRLGTATPATVNAESLAQAGLIRGDGKPLKVLGQGEVGVKLFVAADAFSASAKSKIEAAGGNILVLAEPKPEKVEKPGKGDKSAKKPKTAEAEESTESKAESEATAAVSESSESAEAGN
jgi:large subunit ribosomal protein L15